MRPIKLTMTAFGPYVEPVTLDFERGLRGEKIFLIHGATGAGKTTILDAMCYALYGKTCANARDAKDMRSKDAADDVATEIEFTFALGDKIYTARREIIYYPKRKDNKYQTKCALICGKDVLETRDGAIRARITEMLGFDADQFRQVVVLPQGEFKKFLAADSDKRQEVLNVLFDSAPYREIEDALDERAKNSAAAVKTLRDRLEYLNRQLADTEGGTVDDVAEKLSAAQKKSAALKNIFETAQAQLIDGQNLSRQFGECKQAVDDLTDAQNHLDTADKNFSAAQTEYTRRDGEQSQRKDLERRIRDLQEIQARLNELQSKNSALEVERKTLQSATEAFDDCDAKSKRYETRYNQLTADKARLECEKIIGEILRLETELAAAHEKLSVAEKNLESAQVELTRLQIVNSAAHVATTLKDGEPCPVCGSIEHPAVIAQAIPTVAEIRAAEDKVSRRTREKSAAEKFAARIAGELSSAQRLLDERADTPELAAARENFVSAEKTAAELADCLQRLETGDEFIKKNRDARDSADKAKKSAEIAVARLTGEIDGLKSKIPEKYLSDDGQLAVELAAAQKKFTALDGAWSAAQKNFNTANATRSARAATVEQLQKTVDKFQAALKDKPRPDVPALEQKFSRASDDYDAARDEKSKLEARLDTLKKYSSERDEIKTELAAAEKIADMWRRLSDVANATGKGESDLKISFQRYYLSTMFSEVVVEANNRLKKMSGGRYLFHMKDAGKTKAKSAGLNLEIFDEYTGALRPVETLSGGESFLASLSLALGLAAVVRNNAGGIKLDTIFIDEGFGSLDSETLDDAISTIIDLSGGRLVGIISHVEELKNQMPVRLEVIKGKTGSYAKFERGLSVN